MTQSEYWARHLNPDAKNEYIPRHRQQLYYVTVVLGPAGPCESSQILGLDEVRKYIKGTWDWEVVRVSDHKEILL